MNIQTVAENLRNTIAGKEKMYKEQWNKMAFGDPSWQGDIAKQMALKATIEFLKLNIDELKRILKDVEQCEFDHELLKADLKEANGRVRQLKQQASDDSWITNPDRMGGGGWTAEELDPNRGWK